MLPDHDVVIIDEAHSFPENATNAFAGEIAADAITRLAGMLAARRRRAGDGRRAHRSGQARSPRSIEHREGAIDVGRRRRARRRARVGGRSGSRPRTASSTSRSDYAKRTSQLALGRLEVLRRLAAPDDDDVVWIEPIGRNRRLRIAPVEPGGLIGARLLDRRPVIAVSATLGGEPPFAGVAFQLGLRPGRRAGPWGDRDDDGRLTSNAGRGYVALQTPSSFDWQRAGHPLRRARTCPIPAARATSGSTSRGERLCELVNAAGGRALVLCTSHANVAHFADVLRSRTTHDVLAQGDADTGRLARSFLEDETSVLVGTRSFWGGIDAAGVACVLVVIDKIPFPVPDDPMHAARRGARREREVSTRSSPSTFPRPRSCSRRARAA